MGEIQAADGYEGVTHAGVLIYALDSGAVLLAQRAFDPEDAPEVQETWEMPGGSLNPGEDPLAGAWREYDEEVGGPTPDFEVAHGWRAGPTDNYQGFLCVVEEQFAVDPSTADPAEVQNVAWVTPDQASTLNLRPEFAKLDLSAVIATVSGNEGEMEDDMDFADVMPGPILVHGILAPEDAPTGDGRGFNAGSMSSRPLRLPFRWQESDIGGHDGAVVVGSVDRLMRKDGLIHWEGTLMATPKADEFTDLVAFFGKFGVSVDGVSGSLDSQKTKATGITWFDAVKAAGLTAVAIPAFAEAYVALGPHPDMPADSRMDTLAAAGIADTDIVGARVTFDRGPGWATDPKETKRIHDYWMPGHPGGAKIGWGTAGDFTRAKALIGEKIAKHSPDKMRFLNQIIAQWHHDALGYWPGDWDKPGNDTTAEGRAKRKAHMADGDGAWEAVLTSAGGTRVLPPAHYFDRHPDTDATTIDEPDEDGIRRTYGYAAEWGVCHIGYEGQCVEPPQAFSDEYPSFHLGITRTDEGRLKTGLLTYKVGHRDASVILSETPEQCHFDNVENAWAAVRLGEDERGIWFSGVVLPHVSEEDIVLIEASGQVSGEWKYNALRALLTVNVPGYPVVRASAAYDDEGNMVALAASAFGSVDNGTDESDCHPANRMAALRDAYAAVRMNQIKMGV